MDDRLIEIKQDRPGFNSFFGAWVCREDYNMVVDAGPANSAGRLIQVLEDLALERLDFVLLTHIHIDHCGGIPALLHRFPEAKVICHEKAVDHLVGPDRLWAGSRKVLGSIADLYGCPAPVEAERLIPHTLNRLEGLQILETPGHARHHLSFVVNGRLFAGEAGGNYLVIGDREYLRPATPPRFFLDVYLESLDRLIGFGDLPIRYAHFGRAPDSRRLLERHRRQLLSWREIIGKEMVEAHGRGLVERCTEVLLREDPNLQPFEFMDPDTRERERSFLANSVKGYIGYLRETEQG